ncbi:MAG: hypothetical protein SGPRY_000476 [Prymnesium sp.]
MTHMFHEECVTQHLRTHRSCPICRADCVETPELSPLDKWRAAQNERLSHKKAALVASREAVLAAAAASAALEERVADAEQAWMRSSSGISSCLSTNFMPLVVKQQELALKAQMVAFKTLLLL